MAAAQKEVSDGIAAMHLDGANRIRDAWATYKADLQEVQSTLSTQLQEARLHAEAAEAKVVAMETCATEA